MQIFNIDCMDGKRGNKHDKDNCVDVYPVPKEMIDSMSTGWSSVVAKVFNVNTGANGVHLLKSHISHQTGTIHITSFGLKSVEISLWY